MNMDIDLDRIAEQATNTILGVMADGDSDDDRRGWLAEAILWRGVGTPGDQDAAWAILVDLLNDDDEDIRLQAAWHAIDARRNARSLRRADAMAERADTRAARTDTRHEEMCALLTEILTELRALRGQLPANVPWVG
jgi:hypothetical protein